MLNFFLFVLCTGVLAEFLTVLLPLDRRPMNIGQTVAQGTLGSSLGGLMALALFHHISPAALGLPSIIGCVAGAVAMVWLSQKIVRHEATSPAPSADANHLRLFIR